MACELCQHCDTEIQPGEAVICGGSSYHKKCRKCYVCSETELQDAEVFKGVIFCSSCSKRIFRGCFTAKRIKNRPRRKARSRQVHRRRQNGILEMARRNLSASNSVSPAEDISSKAPSIHDQQQEAQTDPCNMSAAKKSIEVGVTTDMTQDLLKQMNYPTLSGDDDDGITTLAKPNKKKGRRNKRKKDSCSDLRIAELGKSTEIAHMALRGRSEVPVMIKSESHIRGNNKSLSLLNDSDMSGDNDKWSDDEYSKQDLHRVHWMDRRLRSIIKLPYKYFKKNIIDRSSLISVLMTTKPRKNCALKKLRYITHDELTSHHGRGIKQLYGTVNKRKTPYRLGWLQLINKMSRDLRKPPVIGYKIEPRCKHYRNSHSYRCMRTQVMRMAGPTRSRLAVYRSNIGKVFTKKFLRRIMSYNRQYETMLMSQACSNRARSGLVIRSA